MASARPAREAGVRKTSRLYRPLRAPGLRANENPRLTPWATLPRPRRGLLRASIHLAQRFAAPAMRQLRQGGGNQLRPALALEDLVHTVVDGRLQRQQRALAGDDA